MIVDPREFNSFTAYSNAVKKKCAELTRKQKTDNIKSLRDEYMEAFAFYCKNNPSNATKCLTQTKGVISVLFPTYMYSSSDTPYSEQKNDRQGYSKKIARAAKTKNSKQAPDPKKYFEVPPPDKNEKGKDTWYKKFKDNTDTIGNAFKGLTAAAIMISIILPAALPFVGAFAAGLVATKVAPAIVNGARLLANLGIAIYNKANKTIDEDKFCKECDKYHDKESGLSKEAKKIRKLYKQKLAEREKYEQLIQECKDRGDTSSEKYLFIAENLGKLGNLEYCDEVGKKLHENLKELQKKSNPTEKDKEKIADLEQRLLNLGYKDFIDEKTKDIDNKINTNTTKITNFNKNVKDLLTNEINTIYEQDIPDHDYEKALEEYANKKNLTLDDTWIELVHCQEMIEKYETYHTVQEIEYYDKKLESLRKKGSLSDDDIELRDRYEKILSNPNIRTAEEIESIRKKLDEYKGKENALKFVRQAIQDTIDSDSSFDLTTTLAENKTLEEQKTELNARINKPTSKYDEQIEEEKKKYVKRVTKSDEKNVENLTGQISKTNQKISEYDKKIDAAEPYNIVDKNIREYKTPEEVQKVEDAKTTLSNKQQEQKKLEKDKKTIDEYVTGDGDTLKELRKKHESIKNEYDNANTEYQNAQKELDTEASEYKKNELLEIIRQKQVEMDNLENKMEAAQKEVVKFETVIANNQNELNTLEGKITEAENEIKTAQQTITESESDKAYQEAYQVDQSKKEHQEEIVKIQNNATKANENKTQATENLDELTKKLDMAKRLLDASKTKANEQLEEEIGGRER